MRNTSGKTNAERRAERKLKKLGWVNTLPKYYTYEENVSKGGKVYFNTVVNPILKDKPLKFIRPFGRVTLEQLGLV